jgi:hypothetical protein
MAWTPTGSTALTDQIGHPLPGDPPPANWVFKPLKRAILPLNGRENLANVGSKERFWPHNHRECGEYQFTVKVSRNRAGGGHEIV